MTDAPERIALRWIEGAAITSGPLMDHSDYTRYVRADRIEELEAENAMLKADKAKAVEALREIANEERLDHMNGGFCLTDGAWVSRATLAELRMGYVDEGGYDD
jgi:hypothetical protein